MTVDLEAEGTVLVKPRTAAVIKCTSENSPIHWYKNGRRITTDSYYHVDEQNGTLTINKAGISYFIVYVGKN